MGVVLTVKTAAALTKGSLYPQKRCRVSGQEKNIMLDIDSKGWRYENCDTVRIQFSIFSSDTYSYYNSLNNHRQISIFGGEVIPVYSNVENGLGSLISINDQILQLKPPVEFE